MGEEHGAKQYALGTRLERTYMDIDRGKKTGSLSPSRSKLALGCPLYCKDSSLNGATCPVMLTVPPGTQMLQPEAWCHPHALLSLTPGFKQFSRPVNLPSIYLPQFTPPSSLTCTPGNISLPPVLPHWNLISILLSSQSLNPRAVNSKLFRIWSMLNHPGSFFSSPLSIFPSIILCIKLLSVLLTTSFSLLMPLPETLSHVPAPFPTLFN